MEAAIWRDFVDSDRVRCGLCFSFCFEPYTPLHQKSECDTIDEYLKKKSDTNLSETHVNTGIEIKRNGCIK